MKKNITINSYKKVMGSLHDLRYFNRRLDIRHYGARCFCVLPRYQFLRYDGRRSLSARRLHPCRVFAARPPARFRAFACIFRRRFCRARHDTHLYALSHTRSARRHPRHDDALFDQSPRHVEPCEHIVFAHRNGVFEERRLDGARFSRASS